MLCPALQHLGHADSHQAPHQFCLGEPILVVVACGEVPRWFRRRRCLWPPCVAARRLGPLSLLLVVFSVGEGDGPRLHWGTNCKIAVLWSVEAPVQQRDGSCNYGRDVLWLKVSECLRPAAVTSQHFRVLSSTAFFCTFRLICCAFAYWYRFYVVLCASKAFLSI